MRFRLFPQGSATTVWAGFVATSDRSGATTARLPGRRGQRQGRAPTPAVCVPMQSIPHTQKAPGGPRVKKWSGEKFLNCVSGDDARNRGNTTDFRK